MREMRVKSEYIHHKEISAAIGVKVVASGLDEVVPGTPMLVARPGDDLAKLKAEVSKDMTSILGAVSKSGEGVTVQSSTLGALEALLVFLKENKIPVSSISLGPVHKRHLLHTVAMRQRSKRNGVVLAFDVPVTPEAAEFAARNDIPIFSANIIYHLFDRFSGHIEQCEKEDAERLRKTAVFPVVIDSLKSLNDRPMILGGIVREGHLHEGTPLVTVYEEDTTDPSTGEVRRALMRLPIGIVSSIQREGKDVKKATPGMEVAIKVQEAHQSLHFGRQFGEKNILYSNINRASIDAVKQCFADEMSLEDWNTMRRIRDILGIKAAQ
jgi:translation initiation factor 5B